MRNFAAVKKINLFMNKVSENPFKNRERENTSLLVATALFVALYLISNIMAVKVIGLFNLFYFDAGTVTFPFAYMLGDVITELWGFRISKKIIWITFLCNIVLVVCTQIGIWLPSPEHLSATASAYNEVFTYVPRIVIASLVGFLLGELSNAWIMEKIKIRMKGRRMWVRTIGSSAIGYVFDTLPFVLIAFLGTVTTRELLLMMALQYASKLLIESVFGTPMAYATVHLIRKYNR